VPDSVPVGGGGAVDTERLESWKEIAAYLRRDVTTVQRWEKKEGLPIHRHLHDKQGSVHAHKHELDSWRQARMAIIEKDPPAGLVTSTRPWYHNRAFLAVTAAAILMIVITAAAFGVGYDRASRPTYLALLIPPPWEYQPDPSGSLAISPDGRLVVYAATNGQRRSLFVRNLDELSAIALDGTAEAVGPFFSPDGRWIGFSTNSELRKIPVEGGVAITICSIIATARGAHWAADGSIYFALRIPGGLYRVDANGGTPVQLTAMSGTEMFHRAPWITDAGQLLYAVLPPVENGVIYRTDLNTSERSVLLGNATGPRVTPSGHLTFIRDARLFVAQLDRAKRNIVGEPRQIAANLSSNVNGADYAFSNNKTLVFVEAPQNAGVVEMVWVGRDGLTEPVAKPGRYRTARLSPSGHAAVVQANDGPINHLVMYDFANRASRRLTFTGNVTWPVWLPDNKSVAYLQIIPPNVAGQLLTQQVDSSDTAPIIESRTGEFYIPVSWTRDGKNLFAKDVNGALYIVPIGQQPRKLRLQGLGADDPQISPDGKWLAYVSTDGGVARVYVQQFPELKDRWTVSPDGGVAPRWSSKGDRLYYLSNDAMFQVNVTTGDAFNTTSPEKLFTGKYESNYDVSPDGTRFLMLRRLSTEAIRHINVVLNWSP
jgi:serine/threonine-protein kinase